MAGRHSGLDKQRSAFGYVVGHLYFYGQKDSQADEAMNAGGIAKPFTLAAISHTSFSSVSQRTEDTIRTDKYFT